MVRVATAYAVASFVILQLADIALPGLGRPEEDIRWVMIALGGCAPLVLLFSWFYEVTPEGLKPTRVVEEDASITADTGRSLDRVVIGLLSVAVVFLLIRVISLDGGTAPAGAVDETAASPDATGTEPSGTPAAMAAPRKPSVAVLPLVNMSSDAENEHFADGLTEELLNVLAQNDQLRVAARTSSFFFKGKNLPLSEIGDTLGVDHILEGSVRKSGKRIRITVQLIKAADGFHLWSTTYDRELLDIFAIQDEISREVAGAMEVTLIPADPRIARARTTEDSEAYELQLRATEALYTRLEPQVRQALEWFREAHSLDPSYGPPLLGIAEAILVLENNFGAFDLFEADELVDRALDDASALGFETDRYWGLRGLAASHLVEFDPTQHEAAAAAFERALAMNENNAMVYTWYATLMVQTPGILGVAEKMLAWQRTLQLMEQSLALDPLNRVTLGNHLLALWRAGDHEEFWTRARALAERDPDYARYQYDLALMSAAEGRIDEGIEIMFDAPSCPWVWPTLFLLRAIGGDELSLGWAEATLTEDDNAYRGVMAWIADASDPVDVLVARARQSLSLAERVPEVDSLVGRLYLEGEYTLARLVIEKAYPELREEIPRTSSRSSPGTHESSMPREARSGQAKWPASRSYRTAANR